VHRQALNNKPNDLVAIFNLAQLKAPYSKWSIVITVMKQSIQSSSIAFNSDWGS
jgi:hypothetical protein